MPSCRFPDPGLWLDRVDTLPLINPGSELSGICPPPQHPPESCHTLQAQCSWKRQKVLCQEVLYCHGPFILFGLLSYPELLTRRKQYVRWRRKLDVCTLEKTRCTLEKTRFTYWEDTCCFSEIHVDLACRTASCLWRFLSSTLWCGQVLQVAKRHTWCLQQPLPLCADILPGSAYPAISNLTGLPNLPALCGQSYNQFQSNIL